MQQLTDLSSAMWIFISDFQERAESAKNHPSFRRIQIIINFVVDSVGKIITLWQEKTIKIEQQRILDDIEQISQENWEESLILSYNVFNLIKDSESFDLNDEFVKKLLNGLNTLLLAAANDIYSQWTYVARNAAFKIICFQIKWIKTNNLPQEYIDECNKLLSYWDSFEFWNTSVKIIDGVDSFIWWKNNQSFWALEREIEANEDLLNTFDRLVEAWSSDSIKQALEIWMNKLLFFSPSKGEYSSVLDIASRKYIWEWKGKIWDLLQNCEWVWIWYYIDFFDFLMRFKNFNEAWKLAKFVVDNWMQINYRFIEWVEFLFDKHLNHITLPIIKIFLKNFVLKYWNKEKTWT